MKRAQASLEYFILLAIIGAITILAFTNFLTPIREALQGKTGQDGYFQKAAKAITN